MHRKHFVHSHSTIQMLVLLIVKITHSLSSAYITHTYHLYSISFGMLSASLCYEKENVPLADCHPL